MSKFNVPIAIVGMSGVFPDAGSTKEYWENILSKHNAIKDVPETHWNVKDYYSPDKLAEDKVYCRKGGFIPDVNFNSLEFGMPPKVLDVTGVLQMLSLNVAKSVLYDAGYYENEKFEKLKERTSVILGSTSSLTLMQPLSNRLQTPIIEKILSNRGFNKEQIEDIVTTYKKAFAPWEENSFPGLLGNVIAGRIANRFDLGGTNCIVDAACASSLAALRMGLDELQSGRSDMILTGGCDAENSILMYMCFSKTPALSPSENITPFDSKSDGTMLGEGIAMLALRRLEDAEADGDKIYGVIKGVGSSSDGRFKSIYAPRKDGQIRCLKRAYEEANISINQVGLIEAHGTGTKVGDQTEVEALTDVLENSTTKDIALGSVKSQLGHTKAAAGTASIIKVALSLHHKILPPTINIKEPQEVLRNPDIPLYLNTETRPWVLGPNKRKRYAGVSSFGFGGTNFHAVIEEYSKKSNVKRIHSGVAQVLLSDADHKNLILKLKSVIASEILSELPYEQGDKNDLRIGFVVSNLEELLEKGRLAIDFLKKNEELNQWKHPKGIFFCKGKAKGKVAALFSGQGSQYMNMAKGASIFYPEYINLLQKFEDQYADVTKESLTDKIFPPSIFDAKSKEEHTKILGLTQNAQPAIGWSSLAAYDLLTKNGLKIDGCAGHSFGELTALFASGVIKLDDYIFLAVARGQAMKANNETLDSTMLAVQANAEDIRTLIDKTNTQGIYLCNYNSKNQIVIGGSQVDINEFSVLLKEAKIHSVPLHVSAAFHTPLVAHASNSFEKSLESIPFKKAVIPLYRNKDGKAITQGKQLKSGLKKQLLEPVQFQNSIENMINDGFRTFIEFGPKSTLSTIVNKISKELDVTINTISCDQGKVDMSAKQINEASVELAVLGINISSLKSATSDFKEAPVKKGPLVTLSGAQYESKAQKEAWELALNKPLKLQMPQSNGTSFKTEKSDANKTPKVDSTPQKNIPKLPEKHPIAGDNQKFPINRMNGMSSIYKIQEQAANNHKLYLSESTNTINNTFDLLRKIEGRENLPEHIASTLNQGFDLINKSQETVSKTHESYLNNLSKSFVNGSVQADVKDTFLHHEEFIKPNYQPNKSLTNIKLGTIPPTFAENTVAHAEITANKVAQNLSYPKEAVNDAIVSEDITKHTKGVTEKGDLRTILFEIIAEKTGYPQEVLEPTMSFESDLGIDSIKRVEIIGELKKHLPKDTIQDEHLPNFDTIQELWSHLEMPEISDPEFSPSQISPALSQSIAPVAIQNSSVVDIKTLLFEIIAEKTGYPQEVLEPTMSFESDLGIDSIKRVEIIGELKKHLPKDTIQDEHLPNFNTIQELWSHLEISTTPDPEVLSSAVFEAKKELHSSTKQEFTNSLIAIVSDKTGYPQDVLDLGMDLESDLGIDSIKRVEILGALKVANPSLPALDNVEAGKTKTIEELINFFFLTNDTPPKIRETEINSKDSNLQIEPLKEKLSGISQNVISLTRIGEVDKLMDCFDKRSRCLIISDKNSLDYHLKEVFEAKDFEVSSLSLSNQPSTWLDQLSPYSKSDIVIFCLPTKENKNLEILKVLLMTAKFFKTKLDVSSGFRKAFITISQIDGKLGFSDQSIHGDISAGTFGLVKTLIAETKYVFARAIDVQPQMDPLEAAHHIIDELYDVDSNTTDIGISEEGRFTFEISESHTLGKNDLPNDTCFIVTGGAKGITANCITGLAEQQSGSYILLGRSDYDPNPAEWAVGIDDKDLKSAAFKYLQKRGEIATPKVINNMVKKWISSREINQTLSKLHASKMPAKYVSLDINQVAEVKQFFKTEDWLKQSSALSIIHGAGALSDRLIESKTLEDFDKVFNPKLIGLWNIFENIDREKLKFCCMFSSVAGLFGNIGQADYAMANEILNREAMRMQTILPKNARAVSIIWGAWNAGMVSAEIKAQFESRGITLIEPNEGVDHFVDICLNEKNGSLLMVGPKSGLAPKKVNLKEFENTSYSIEIDTTQMKASSLLAHHKVGGNTILPVSFAIGRLANEIEKILSPIYFNGIEQVQVNNKIVVDETLPDLLIIKLKLKEVKNNILHADAKLLHPDTKRAYYSYHNILISQKKLSKPADIIEVKEIPTEQEPLGYYHDNGLFHGKRFQIIEASKKFGDYGLNYRCNWEQSEVVDVSHPEEPIFIDQHSAQNFCPMYGDAIMQAAALWVRAYEKLASLPMKIENLRCYEPIARGTKVIIKTNLLKKEDHQTELSITGISLDNTLLLSANVSVVKSAMLHEKFMNK